jgi:AcrR family transcriptional regulator
MAPPRKHETDVILDAARALVLTDGPRAASIASIAKVSGAPAGTLYHRFGNRDGILAAAWLRALDRFQAQAMAAEADSALDGAVAMAVSVIGFARELPEDARLLLLIRPDDLLDGDADVAGLREAIDTRNAPLRARLVEFARALYGSADARSLDAVSRAVVDLPYAVVRRHAHRERLPSWLEDDVAASVRAVLITYGR